MHPFSVDITPDWESLIRCIWRKGTPQRVHHIELFLDREVQEAICRRFGLGDALDRSDPHFGLRREVAIQRFLGYDYVRCTVEGMDMPLNRAATQDTAALSRNGGRSYVDEHVGPITNWQEFETYPWPDVAKLTTRNFEWYQRNLPDDMCIIASGGFAHFAEFMNWLMGYETLCYALYEQRDLVQAIMDRLMDIYQASIRLMLQFDRVKIVWGSDDMGFKTGTLVSPTDLRQFVLPGHKEMARLAHEAGRPYLLHSCGQLEAIMEDLVADVKIDARHSFEDTIEDVVTAKQRYGSRIALLGGIDVDFLCRADEPQIRQRVRRTLEQCHPGGGYCLGTGNSVANYIPLDSYLTMLDEGRRFA
jgi:uroporphyrinogen decarboxylase